MGRHRNLSENYINKMKEENTRSIGSAITYMMVNMWKAIFIRLAPQRLGGYGRRNRQQMKMAYTPNKVRAISFFWSQFLTFISMFNSLTATSYKYSTLLPSFSFLSSLPSFVLLIAHQSPHPPLLSHLSLGDKSLHVAQACLDHLGSSDPQCASSWDWGVYHCDLIS